MLYNTIKTIVTFLLCFFFYNVSAQIVSKRLGLQCLPGMQENNELVQEFIAKNKLVKMEKSEVTEEHQIGYKAENGIITALYFYDPYDVPSYWYLNLSLQHSYKSRASGRADLKAPHLIKDNQIVLEENAFGMMSRCTYVWNGKKRKRKKDFDLSRVEIHLTDPNKKIYEECKTCFVKPKPVCFEGDCLLCDVNRPVADVLEDLKKKYEVLEYTENSDHKTKYYHVNWNGGNLELHTDNKRLIDHLVMGGIYDYRGELPFGLKTDMTKSAVLKHLGVYKSNPENITWFWYYYADLELTIWFEYGRNSITKIEVHRRMLNLPVCAHDTPVVMPQYGCISGDCENGFGRARYNGNNKGVWEYEGNFKNGVFHGDGCKIEAGNYYFNHYFNGEYKRPLVDTLCVDQVCGYPPEFYDSTQKNIIPSWDEIVTEMREKKFTEPVPLEFEEYNRVSEYNALQKATDKLKSGRPAYGYEFHSERITIVKENDEWVSFSTRFYKNRTYITDVLITIQCDVYTYIEYPDGRKSGVSVSRNFIGNVSKTFTPPIEGEYKIYVKLVSTQKNIPIKFLSFIKKSY